VSVPGHYQAPLTLIGDLVSLHKGVGGKILGGLVRVEAGGARLEIAVVADPPQWPAGIAPGALVYVRGELRQEQEVWHRRNSHFVAATQPIETLQRRKACP
jgi:hypothetical protein